MKTTILFDGPLQPRTTPGRFAPLAGSAFRLLGLTAAATQREVFDAATRIRLALKVGAEKRFATDLDWLAPVSRAEAEARDALGRLSAPAERARERLFWFHRPLQLPPPRTIPELVSAAAGLSGETEGAVADRHGAALLLLAGLHRLDSTFSERDAWRRAFQLWREVCDAEAFWSLLVAADLKGGFEPAVTFGEAAALRAEVPRLISIDVARFAETAAAAGRLADARRALDLLRAASLPAPLLAGYEGEVIGPFEDRCDECLLEAFSLVEYFYGPADAETFKRTFFCRALAHIEQDLKPALRDLLEVGGGASVAVRRTCAAGARRILRLAEAYEGLGDGAPTAAGLTELARAIAPPDSPERREADARPERATVRAAEIIHASETARRGDVNPAAETNRPITPNDASGPAAGDREAEEYEAAALVSLRRERPEWLLIDGPGLFPGRDRPRMRLLPAFAIYGAVAVLVFLLFWSGAIEPGRSRHSPSIGVLMNYNLPAMRPAIPPRPVITPKGLAPRISVAELRRLLEGGRATVVDVRGRAEYEAGHLPGAVWMPDEEVEKRYRSLLRPKRRIVFYCDCLYDLEADSAAFRVRIQANADVAVLAGGYQAWLAETARPSSGAIAEPPPLEAAVEPPRVVERSAKPRPGPQP